MPWNVIAAADYIVVGKLERPALDKGNSNWSIGSADLQVTRFLKGRAALEKLHFRYLPIKGYSDGLHEAVKSMQGKLVIVALVGGHPHGSEELSFEIYAGDGMDGITPDSPAAEQLIRDEMDREPMQATTMATDLTTLNGGAGDKVQAAIESMSSDYESRRDAGVNALLSMDCEAVPYIIKYMNDRRSFLGVLQLPNPPDFFEAYAQYDPKEMLEALSMILTWKTGAGRPDHAEVGIDDGERQKVYDYWLVYLAHQRDWKNSKQWPGRCD